MKLVFYLEENSKTKWKLSSTISGYHNRTIYSVKWSKLNNLIATGSADNKIHIFKETSSNESGESTSSLALLHVEEEAHSQDCNCVDWHPTQANILASCSDDGVIKIWRFNQIDD